MSITGSMAARPKRILWHGATAETLERLEGELRESGLDFEVELRPCCDAATLTRELDTRYVNLVVFDLRGADPSAFASHADEVFTVLDRLDQTDDVESRYAFDRILVVLPGCGTSGLDRLLLALGSRGISNVLRDEGEAFLPALRDSLVRLLTLRKKGRRALCAAGGGITGVYFHLGAMKCLDDCLGGEGLNGFDMYFGISAGAVVTAPIAVGYSVDELMAAIAQVPGGRIAPLSLRLFRLGHVNAPTFSRRLGLAAKTTLAGLWSAVTGKRQEAEELVFDYADLIAAPFKADRFERLIREVLSAPGGTNDFRELPRPLYVGATDQDARAHVLFGDEQHLEVPISSAVQASLSINPAFSATRIGDRYYEDGAVTRTSNFVEAIRRGATLVLVFDPFVPYVARTPGFADRRGMLYNIDQDVRTISYTRYETTRNWVLRQHPEVSSYTFVPANRARRLMAMNPMDHRPFLEVWRGGYLSMHQRLGAIAHRFTGDLAAHGLRFSTHRADEVAERLHGTTRLALADFFPGRELVIRRPPLCRE